MLLILLADFFIRKEKYELSPVMISRWIAEFLDRASAIFDKLLSVSRTSTYRPSKAHHESQENVQLMHRIDEIFMNHPSLATGA